MSCATFASFATVTLLSLAGSRDSPSARVTYLYFSTEVLTRIPGKPLHGTAYRKGDADLLR
jgi:hypothetical protein